MTDHWVERLLKRPYVTCSFLALFVFMGLLGYGKIERKLFPESNYPEIAVVIMQPGGSAQTLAANVSVPVEEELYTLDHIRRVFSSTIDEVSVIHAEFDYSKDLDLAASDVANALDKISSTLPQDILPPQIHKISAATAPILVVAISPKNAMPLEDVRQLAEHGLRQRLLKLPGVANVDVFGGYKKELQVIVDKHQLERHGITMATVLAALQSDNRDYAIGYIDSASNRYLLKVPGRATNVEHLRGLRVNATTTLGDVATVYFGHYRNSSAYFGNGHRAIALAIQRGLDADVIRTIDTVEKELRDIRASYPGLRFEITDTQKETIVQSTANMFSSLRDSIVMSIIVVFLFLASFRQMLVVLLAIPLVYSATIAMMWLGGLEFNVVTLTGIILALGLLLDDAVVVMENIERHYTELGRDIRSAVIGGTQEIMFADFSGTVTTMIALAPILFVGGYPQTVFRPLATTLLLALTASYIISISAVPLLSMYILRLKHPWLLRAEAFFQRHSSRANSAIHGLFANLVAAALRRRAMAAVYFILLALAFVVSIKVVMPTVGRELMPPMDTGGVKIAISVDPNLSMATSAKIAAQANDIIRASGKLERLSTVIGSEAGVQSIGSGAGYDHIAITATYVNRHQRKQTIWQIEHRLRRELAAIADIKRLDVVDFGATALSSIRANIDVLLAADNFAALDKGAEAVEQALRRTGGVVSVGRSWDLDRSVYNIAVDRERAAHYGLDSGTITAQLQPLLRGALISTFPARNSSDYAVRVWLPANQRNSVTRLENTLLATPSGPVPLCSVATVSRTLEPSSISREGLNYTINVYGYREKTAISHIMDNFAAVFNPATLPAGVTLAQVGDIKQFKNSAGRMAGAIALAVMLIFFTLITFFDSIKVAVMIILSIPLTIIGVAWTLLALNYHVAMPAMMGFILLSGIIVNNAILLIHFAQEKMSAGMSRSEAMLESIRIRTRPVLMTAFAVAAGMLPVARGNAIGLERLAPLGAVAIGGLLVGTLLTLVFIPLLFVYTASDTSCGNDS